MHEVLAEGRWIRLIRADGWEWAERTNASGIVVLVAITEAGELVLVEQFRKPVGRRVLELPAGLAGDLADQPDEALETAALRELEEETGFTAERVERLTEGPVSAGFTSEVVTFFRCSGLTRVGIGGGDESEDIVVHVVAMPDIPAFLADRAQQGVAIDPKVWAGMWFARS